MRIACLCSVFVLLFGFTSLAAEKAHHGDRLTMEKAELNTPVCKGLTIGKKFTGILPAGYKEVVTNSQREEIYKLQEEYFEAMEILRIRGELLKSERNQKMDAMLSGEQRAKLKTILGNLESEKSVRKGERTPARKPKVAEESKTETAEKTE